MQYLYVCLFSNGHIKAGRSVNPESRIASHEDRVSCLGVELVEFRTFLCASHVIPAEQQMLSRCCAAAEKINKNEWFVGLDFLSACEFASEASLADFDAPSVSGAVARLDIEIIKSAIEGAGGPSKVARELNCSTQAVYFWQTGKRTLPAEHCPALERLNEGRIKCEQMRPDVDWAYLRGTQAKA